MNAILVTGGAGFIGSHLCERFLRDDIRVICLDNFDSFYDPQIKIKNVEEIAKKFPLFELVTGDIRNPEHLNRIFQKTQVDFVVHLAARAGV
ncbi:MAG: GDP-mannose 4,6-dehydratase, partial [Thermodesulfobacteriota bacterium]